MYLFLILIIGSIIIRFLGMYLIKKTKNGSYNRPKTIGSAQINESDNSYSVNNQELEDEQIEYTGHYQRKLLLTKNEWYEYRKLKQLAEGRGLQVCPKVRLLDLIEPRRGDPKFKTLFYKIQAKHVDFVICDNELRVKAILELDDNSHDHADRMERDKFVDLILKDVGYIVIRTRSVTDTTLDVIENKSPVQ